MTVTEQEVTQYDRQIRLWGLEAQNRLRSSKILLFGLKPLGAEICKNLVLAGIGEISVCDSEPINEKVKRKYQGSYYCNGKCWAFASMIEFTKIGKYVFHLKCTSSLRNNIILIFSIYRGIFLISIRLKFVLDFINDKWNRVQNSC